MFLYSEQGKINNKRSREEEVIKKFRGLGLILSSVIALTACNNGAKDIEKAPKDETKQEQQSEKVDTKATDTNDKDDNANKKNPAKQEEKKK